MIKNPKTRERMVPLNKEKKEKKHRRMIGIIMLLVFTLIISATATLAMTGTLAIDITYRNIQITVNGDRVEVPSENEPFIYNGRTYVPLRVVSEALGYDVGWDDATSTVMIEAEEDLPVNGDPTSACESCWNYQPTDMKPNPGWEDVDMEGLTREELVDVLGCPPHVIRMTSVVSAANNKELWVYHPYDEDPTGLYVWLKGDVYHDYTLDEFNGFWCYQMMDFDFWE